MALLYKQRIIFGFVKVFIEISQLYKCDPFHKNPSLGLCKNADKVQTVADKR